MSSAAELMQHLAKSRAGMRLVAQTKRYNQADFPGLREFIREHYSALALEDAPAAARLAEWKALYRQYGRLRITRVIAVGEHDVIAALEGEQTAPALIVRIIVEEDYPHKIALCAAERLPDAAPQE